MKKIEPEHQTADECYKTDKNSPNKSHKNEDTTAKPDTEIIGKMKKIAFWGFVFIGLYLIISNLPIFAPKEIDPKAGLLIVFFVGFLTSFHCIGMCSGLILAY
ncbi:MAG: sulfite exporter TauE/SafE family protein, partial [Candidatus Micrarchaeota archaeon]|nr:sulfite exporter TauE/SafE family protein [Candidatus Micrarchaeota archaeon]